MPLLISGIHQSTSLILLVALIGCDIVVRPWVLRRAAILVPIGVNLALVLLRERMFAILGFSSSDVMIVAAILFCLIAALAMLRPVRSVIRAGWEPIAEWRSRTIEAVALPFADALIVFTAWLGLILLSYLASRNDSWYRLVYFWSELSPRYIGMFQLTFWAGILFPLILMLQAADRWLAASAAVVMLTIGVSQVTIERTRLADGLRVIPDFDRAVSGQRNVYADKAPTMRDETSWYYLLVRNALLGDRSLAAFFGKPPS
jgi:hypothetical protein